MTSLAVEPVTRLPLVEMRGIVKRYDDLVALDGVDLTLAGGGVHAVVGENGAGKTTLMQVLAGVQPADAGTISIDGAPARIRDVEAASRLGIAMVHQHFMLFGSLTVAENLTINREPVRGHLFDRAAAEHAVERLGERYGLKVDPRARVSNLSVGDLQRLEILRALYRGARILILDEPTGLLTPQETDGLFRLVRELTAAGATLVFISHKLEEVLEISSRITVLRDGRVTGTFDADRTDARELALHMVGRETPRAVVPEAIAPGPIALEIRDLRGPGLAGISLSVRAGEVVGVAGVAGNGQTELAEAVAGLSPPSAGTIRIAGRDVTDATVRARREAGLAYIPDDRFRRGLAADASVADNLAMGHHRRPPIGRRGLIDPRAVRRRARELIDRFRIRTESADDPARTLSGGNAQRVVLARELSEERPVIVAAQPTRGIDIAATEFVHRELLAHRRRGAATLLISADLAEVMALSDRIVVLHRGRIMGEVDAAAADVEQLGLWMAGISSPAPLTTA